jgi:hypothetical protein
MDHCALLFFGVNEKWTVQVYDTKLMRGMEEWSSKVASAPQQ